MGRPVKGVRLRPDARLDLPEVTLIAASSVALAATVRALKICMGQAQFGQIKLLTDASLENLDLNGITQVAIDRLSSRADYSRFMLRELHRHVETDFVLCVQWDGYILDANYWRDAFLDYDFIGAPWPQFQDGMTVGNGGFSLRSQKLLRACADPRILTDQAEDTAICRAARPLLEQEYGICFAPEEIARQFAFERTRRNGDEFGFHGAFNMINLMNSGEFRVLLSSIEPNILGRRERRDILCKAVSQFDTRVIARMAALSIKSRLAGPSLPNGS